VPPRRVLPATALWGRTRPPAPVVAPHADEVAEVREHHPAEAAARRARRHVQGGADDGGDVAGTHRDGWGSHRNGSGV
jgi:hypothetical protein